MRPITNGAPQDAVELALIRSLTAAFIPSAIMTAGFAAAGGLIVWITRDAMLLVLLVGGLVACAMRIAAALRLLREGRATDLSIEKARRLERDFQISHTAFAAMLGLFSFRAFLLESPQVHMLMICLVMGYAAGVATTVTLRPRIAIPSILLAMIPTAVAAMVRLDPAYMVMGMMMAALLVGGVQNVRFRHARAREEIMLRISFGNIAREDGLTALPNRIALREWFDERALDAQASGLIAVHYLDLDGFKPVNDRFGHPCGDALLTAVGRRIKSAIRSTDIAARLGGDEFAVVQFGIDSADHAENLARRLHAAISRAYDIDGQIVRISTSIGYVVTASQAGDLEEMLSLADQALYRSKRQGGGVTRHDMTPAPAREAA